MCLSVCVCVCCVCATEHVGVGVGVGVFCVLACVCVCVCVCMEPKSIRPCLDACHYRALDTSNVTRVTTRAAPYSLTSKLVHKPCTASPKASQGGSDRKKMTRARHLHVTCVF